MPDSGTSFLSVLVHNLGLSLGDPGRIKWKSDYHPWGRGENLDMLYATWVLLDPRCKDEDVNAWEAGRIAFPQVWFLRTDQLPDEPLSYEQCAWSRGRISDIVKGQGVELTKDASAPWTYKCFPDDTKFIVISRNWRNMHHDFLSFLGYTEENISNLQAAWVKWHRVCLHGIKSERKWLQLEYEDFRSAFNFQVARICGFLGIENPKSMDELYTLYCPREGRPA